LVKKHPVLFNFARALWPIFLALAVGFGIMYVWYKADPSTYRDSFELLIIGEQLQRAHSATPADYILVGDSSCLMGADASLLSQLLDRPVESFCTFGYVGIAAQVDMAKVYLKSGGHISNLVILLNRVTLSAPDDGVTLSGYESMIEKDKFTHRAPAFSFSDKFANDFFIRFVNFIPIPEHFMEFYGTIADIRRAVRDGHGSLIDPHGGADERKDPYDYEIGTSLTTERLASVARLIKEIGGPTHVRLGFTPVPENHIGPATNSTLSAAKHMLLHGFGLSEKQWLELPVGFPNRFFATKAHLNKNGRQKLTELIAVELAMSGSRKKTSSGKSDY
jgi:hypothetical protein